MSKGEMPSGEMEARDQASEEQGTTEVQMREMPYVPDGPESLGETGASGLSSQTWSLWELRQGSTAIYAPAATAWGENRIGLFAIGLNSQIYHQWWNGTQWSDWEFLEGTYSISAPTAVSVGQNRLDVFWIGIDKQVYRRSWNGTQWSQRESLGGVAIHGVAATSWGPDRIDLFTVGTDSSLYHKYWDGSTWSAWKIMKFQGHEAVDKSSTCISAPAAVSWGANRIDVFALGIDNYVYHAWGDGSSEWRGWEKLGGPCIHGVAAASRGVNSLDLFSISTDTVGTDNHLYYRSWNGSSWSRWENLGGACISAPTAVAGGENRLDVLVIGTRSSIWQKSWVKEGGGLKVSSNFGGTDLVGDLSNTQAFVQDLFSPNRRKERWHDELKTIEHPNKYSWLITANEKTIIKTALASAFGNAPDSNLQASDRILMSTLNKYFVDNNLVLWVPQLQDNGKNDGKLKYQLTRYQNFDWGQPQTQQDFLELFLAGAHFVVIHSSKDLPENIVSPPNFYDLVEGLGFTHTFNAWNSHYAGLLSVTGRAYPNTIKKDEAPQNCPLITSFLAGITAEPKDDPNSFFQLEGWPGFSYIGGGWHGDDYTAHKATKWNISTYGACPYSEKRGTTVFLAPNGFNINTSQETIMQPYQGSWKYGWVGSTKYPQGWMDTNLISL